jgi:hypothetical protein
MDRHKVSTEPLVKATQILARNGYATARSLSLDIPCHLRTADRLVAYLKDTGDYVKQGYGIAPKDSATKIPPHSPTFRHKDSATPKESTTYKDSATSEHSATKIPPHSATNIPPSQLLSNTEAVQNGPRSGGAISNGAAADQVGFLLGMKASKASTSGSQKEIEEPAAPPLALRAADDYQQRPWAPDENEQASLDYQESLVRKHKTTEITDPGGAAKRSSCDGLIGKDRDMAAYHEDLDKLIAFLSEERDARKLKNRQLGKARGKGKITRSELRNGKKDHSELLRVIVGLTEDRESGELRYYNLQAAGETLDMCWPGWRQKMAMDPDLIKHYEDMAAQAAREARKAAWEAKRHAAQDLQDEIAATETAAVQEHAAVGEANMLDDDTLTDEELDEAAWRQSIEEEQAGDPAACGTYGWVPMIVATEPDGKQHADAEWDAALKEPVVHEDMATMKARHERKLQAERDAVVARRDREMAQEALEAQQASVILQASEPVAPPTTPVAPTDPSVTVHCTIAPLQGPTPVTPTEQTVEQRILSMLAAAVDGRNVSLVAFRRDLGIGRDETTAALNMLVYAKKILEEGQENGRSYRLPRVDRRAA